MTDLKNLRLGIGICGSFCTFKKTLLMVEKLTTLGIDVYPIMTFNAYTTSTRFYEAKCFIEALEKLTGKHVVHSLVEAEPYGPKNLIDAFLIAPCTGNTLAKINYAIVDNPVALVAKSLMRNGKPLIIALSTNDGLGLNMKNIGSLICVKNIYFVPFGQDNFKDKPFSLISNLELVPLTLEKALQHEQLQPILIHYDR